MSADENRPDKRRARQVEKAVLPEGAARRLRDALYELYLRADGPTLDELAARIADEDLPGSPGRDTISRIVSGRELPATQQDAIAVAVGLAHLCGRDAAVIADRVSDLWVAAKMASPDPPPARVGRPVGECDPIDLEVHRAINIPNQDRAAPVLPAYVSRGHDAQLSGIVAEAKGGRSRFAVLVGGSSTGKTRACWEAIQGLPDQWRVWHPIDPSRPEAAAAALQEVGPRTVVWLNEAQHYLLTAHPDVGERVAAGLRTLLADRARGPVLVLATMWPDYWSTVTTRPAAGGPDPHALARELLAGADIPVPDTFTTTDLQALHDAAAGDLRLAHAAEHAQAGRVTQHLAGVPELLARYHNASPVARAVIDVAIDARRLGHPLPVPHALLQRATPGYLSDHDWQQAGDDWLEHALVYTAKPCHGVPGPLTRIRPRPGDPPTPGPHYRLADYLDQIGRTTRRAICPPASFWDAVATHVTDPATLSTVAYEAQCRGRYRRAARLYRLAADLGGTGALRSLARLREDAGDPAEAARLCREAASFGDSLAFLQLARLLEEDGDHEGATATAWEAAGRGDTYVLADLARQRAEAGDHDGATRICEAIAGDLYVLPVLAELRDRAGDHDGATRLYREAAERGHTGALRNLAQRREEAGDQIAAAELYQEAFDRHVPGAGHNLVRLRALAGDHAGALTLAREDSDRTGGAYAFVALAEVLAEYGDHDGAIQMYWEAADRGHPNAIEALAELRARAGDHAGATELYRRSAAGGGIDALRILAEVLERAGDHDGAARLCMEYADRGDPNALGELADLWERAGADTQATQLRAFGLNEDGSAAGPW